MSSHIIIPPKKPQTFADKAEIKKIEGELARDLDGAPVTEAGTKQIKVPKGTRVTIGGKEYIAQSDEGITVRGFTHAENGQPTSVVIIGAPTKEAAAFASALVAGGQMLSEDEVLWRRQRGYPIDPALTYDRKTGKLLSSDPRKRRAAMTDDEVLESWLAHLANSDPRVKRDQVELELAKSRLVEQKQKLIAARSESTASEVERSEEVVELSTKGKIK